MAKLTTATVDEMYALADGVSPRFRALVLLAAFGGHRCGELIGVTRRDIDLSHRTLELRAQRQQSKSGTTIVGPPKSAAGRRSLSQPAEIVPAIEDHLHDLRHGAGTLAAATGARTKELMRRLGHATPHAALRGLQPRTASCRYAIDERNDRPGAARVLLASVPCCVVTPPVAAFGHV